MGSIYKITNTVNGKAYIGQTIHDAVKGRIADHLNGNSKGSRLVKRAIEKYGKDAFTYDILYDGIIPKFLDALEIAAIEKFNTIAPHGYNLTTGGEGGSHCKETRQKLSEINIGKKHSEETRRKLSEINTGKKLLAETCRKMSEARKGKTRSPETICKMSESKRGEKNPNYGKSPSIETRRKLSESRKGERNPNYGKSPSVETRRKLSEAQETPDRIAARKFYFSLPSDMNLKEKKKRLRQRFSNRHHTTIYRWCKKFHSERRL